MLYPHSAFYLRYAYATRNIILLNIYTRERKIILCINKIKRGHPTSLLLFLIRIIPIKFVIIPRISNITATYDIT